jgi:hypothetical protein
MVYLTTLPVVQINWNVCGRERYTTSLKVNSFGRIEGNTRSLNQEG